MIGTVHARNYRSLGDVEVELGPLTVLVGQNGSGKSNFVDVLHFLTDAFTHGLDTAVVKRHGIEKVRRWTRSKPYDIAIGIRYQAEHLPVEGVRDLFGHRQPTLMYDLEVKSIAASQHEVKRESLRIEAQGPADHFEVEKGLVTRCSDERFVGSEVPTSNLFALVFPGACARYFARTIRGFGFYSIFPNVLRKTQTPSAERPLDSHGANLFSVLRGMEKGGSEFLPEVVVALGQVVPGIANLKVEQVGGHLALSLQHDGSEGRGPWFDASQESDGTLRMIGVLTALYQDPWPELVAIEEPELTVHPGMLPLLRDCIVEATKRTQVIITTHSPDLMSLFDVDVLRVVEMTESGTKIGPVAEWQKQAIRDQLFSPGELVRAEGLQMATPAE